jgi:hypothetical protein
LEDLAVEHLGIFMTIWSILRSLEISRGHLVYFAVIWYIFHRFGILDKENLATLTGSHSGADFTN